MDRINSCQYILSSSLHGLICADVFNKPNLWLDQYHLPEGDFKFIDYLTSQNRPVVKITNLAEVDEKRSLLYSQGNQIDLKKLVDAFPFK